MSFSSLARFLSLSITPQTCKISASNFATSSSLSHKLYTHLQRSPSNTERTLSSLKPELDPTCVYEVLNKCSFANAQVGLRFFVWAAHHSKNYRHSSYMYGKVCNLFKIKQNPQVIFDLIESYRVHNCVVSVKTFKVVLNLCREGRLADEALIVLKKMPEFGLRADTNAYNVVIKLFCDKGDVDLANKLMQEMGLIDLHPDMVTYVSMIKGFCNVNRLEEACGLFKVMKIHGCEPNVVAYSALLEGVCRFGNVEKALELLGEMEKMGGDCSPNVLTYTTVIQSLCEKGMSMDALRILDRMYAYGCVPNRVTVSTLIKGLCTDDHLDEVYKLIDRVSAGQSVSHSDCYSSLVVSLLRIKKVEEAEKLFRRLLASEVALDGLACSLLLKELCLQKRMLDGFCLFVDIEKMAYPLSMDSDVYSILLAGLCQQNHSVEASRLASSMLDKRIRLKAPYVDNIVEYLKKFAGKELVAKFGGI